MRRSKRLGSVVGGPRFVSALGGLYVVLAVGRAALTAMGGGGLVGVSSSLVLVGLPGLLIVYGGYRLPRSDLHPDVYGRIVIWCLGGFAVLLGVVGLRVVSPGVTIDNPVWSTVLATAFGSAAGLAIGAYEGRALSRAREAEERNRELQRYETLIEQATDVNAVLDPDGTFRYLTPSVEHVLGYAPDELVGEVAFEYVHPADREATTEAFTEILDSDETSRTVVFRFAHADGGWVALEGRGRNLLDDPVVDGIVAYTHDVTERERLEDDLRRERDLRERIVETSPIGIATLDQDGEFTFLNSRAERLLGRSMEELEECSSIADVLELTGPEAEPLSEVDRPSHRILESGEPVYDVECSLTRPDGERVWLSVNGAPLSDETGEIEHVVMTFEDVTDRKRHRDRLVSLTELSQDLEAAETEREVADLVASAAGDTLDLPLVAIDLYDDADGRLEPTARTEVVTDLVGDGPLFDSDRSVPWQVFVDQTPAVYDDLPEAAEADVSETPLRSAIVHPLGDHGVFVAGTTTPNEFSEAELSLARILVGNTVSALERVARERTLRDRRDALEARTTALERVQRLNGIIRGITQELIEASTREEVVQSVTDRLVTTEAYRLAWIGARDSVTDAIRPDAWAGAEDGYLDAITVTADGSEADGEPMGAAVRTRETQVRNALSADPPFDAWQRAAVERGYQAAIAVPLTYQDSPYGVLGIYADDPEVFDEMERAVLAELGETIGYTLNALERKQALVSDESVELEFELRSATVPLVAFAAENDCEFEFENIVQTSGDSPRIFFTIRGVDPETVLEFGDGTPEIEMITLISQREDEALFECRLRRSAFFSALVDHGAMPRTLTTTGGVSRAVIRVPLSASIRTYVELFEARFEEVDLVARREVDEPIKTQQEFEAEFATRLTERQEEILETAYTSGFFDWPRGASAQDLAEMLDVSQPTVSRHIRAGEKKLFELMFEEP